MALDWPDARTLCRDLQRGTVSALDLMQEVYQRIDALNPTLNAIVSLLPRDTALELAAAADRVPVAARGPLHGLPWAAKDAVDVAGFATTWGFVPWKDNVARADDALAARLRDTGVIFIGRSNMPELGLGSHTFNSLYGTTVNPYDTTRTAGGSSGGAAVALASGMLPLADGSDMGGSLRNPASFCNVVGFRPSIGRMPHTRGMAWFGRLATTGPMAANVADCALAFSVMAGPDAHDPLTLPEPGERFLDALVPLSDARDLTIGYPTELPGMPIDPAVRRVMDEAARALESLGARIVDACFDLGEAMEVFQVQRAAGLAVVGDALDRTQPDWRQQAKDTAIWNIEQGQALTARALLESELARSRIYQSAADFFTSRDALLLPAAQVPPFDAQLDWIREIDGQPMDTYIDWMAVCCTISVTGLPAISVPAGFTDTGLPVGAQLVGAPRGDLALLRLAHAFEAATGHGSRKPAIHATKD